jgi:hypothetical protein
MLSNNKSPAEGDPSPATFHAYRSLVSLAAIFALMSSGCASTNVADTDPYKYNPNTGYPFIGGPLDHPRP